MKIGYCLVLAILLASALCLYEKSTSITTITNLNLNALKNGMWLLNFYDLFDYWSKNFEPEFNTVAEALHNIVNIGAINIK